MDKLVLGIARTHDVSAALFRGTRLLGVAEAERVFEEKHARGPDKIPNTVERLLDQAGCSPADIDVVSIADTGRERLEELLPHSVQAVHSDRPMFRIDETLDVRELPLGETGIAGLRDDVEHHYVCHHAAHALGAVYLSGFEDCAVLVIDGYGVCCGTIAYYYSDGRLKRLNEFTDAVLLGWRYQVFGHFVKEISSEHTDLLDLAGKVMGLNAYGTPRPDWVHYFSEWFRGGYEEYEKCWDTDQLFFQDLLGEAALTKDSASVDDTEFLDVVASMQAAFTAVVGRLAERLRSVTGSKNVSVSGGCALNVLANNSIASHFEQCFVQPNAGDSGLSVGAGCALAVLDQASENRRTDRATALASPFLGLKLDDNLEVEQLIPSDLYNRKLPEEDPILSRLLATAIAGDEIIGLVRGACEIGPRALGNRSILANAANPYMRDILNQKVKNREWWRPFAPVCRAEDADEYFDVEFPSAYMLTTAIVRSEFRTLLKSACHEDGTARLQVVPDRDWHPLLWDILTELKAQTGYGVAINTSFNEGGKPLLNRAATAFDVLKRTNMSKVWCNGWLVAKEPITVS